MEKAACMPLNWERLEEPIKKNDKVTHVPRISLNSNIFLMSSTCFFHEHFPESPFSRAMVQTGKAVDASNSFGSPGEEAAACFFPTLWIPLPSDEHSHAHQSHRAGDDVLLPAFNGGNVTVASGRPALSLSLDSHSLYQHVPNGTTRLHCNIRLYSRLKQLT